ncbi:MAG: hypothetical protein IPF92_10185 [Myxococcales bacterium]|nr:hypothetical protein [Myxococcales bacterium]
MCVRVGSARHGGGRARALATLLWLAWLATLAPPARADVAGNQQGVAATLFDRGRELMDAGRYAQACDSFEESQRLDPGGGTLMNLALCRSLEGRTSTATQLFTEALAAARRDKRDDRVEECQRSLAELGPRVPTVTLIVEAPAPSALVPSPKLTVRLNGGRVPALAWGAPVPVDPGDVLVEASAPGFVPFSARLRVREGQRESVRVPPLVAAAVAPAPPAPGRDTDASAPPLVWATAGRPLAVARLDVDGALRGAVVYGGFGVGVTRFAELSAGALLGATSGFEVGARALVPLGPLRPFATLAIPFFFADGVRAGVRAGAGLEWSLTRHLAVFGQVAGVYFPAPPRTREAAAFLPALGVVGRL